LFAFYRDIDTGPSVLFQLLAEGGQFSQTGGRLSAGSERYSLRCRMPNNKKTQQSESLICYREQCQMDMMFRFLLSQYSELPVAQKTLQSRPEK